MQKAAMMIGIAGGLAASGCTATTEPPAMEKPLPNCPVLESEGWTASIDPVPQNPTRSQLTVSGRLTMPTPGYTFAWEAGRLDRSAVPSFELRLLTKAPDGMVPQVLDTRTVTYSGPAAAPRYRTITVTCEGRVLGKIENIS